MQKHTGHIMKASRALHFSVMAFFALLMVISGCADAAGQNEKASRYYEDALARFEKNDFDGAIIQLKNALQQEPKMLAAHVLLGRAFLEKNQPADAEVEFDKALQSGVDLSIIAIPRAQAYANQGKYKRLLDSISPDGLPPDTLQGLLSIRANAQMELGDLKAARNAIEQAYNITSAKPPHLILVDADLAFREGRPDVAKSKIDQAIKLDPKGAPYWNFRATVFHSEGNFKAALADYDQAIALNPKYFMARLARASLLLDTAQDKKAEVDLQYLSREHPEDPRAIYLNALLSERRHDSVSANKSLRRVVNIIDAVPPETINQLPQLLLLGGLAHFGLNEPDQARSYLQRLLPVSPGHTGARKLLGIILLKANDSSTAIEVLSPALKTAPDDADVLSLLASAYMGQKEYRKASVLLERAVQVSGGAPRFESSLGFSLLGSGQENLAFEHLSRAFRKDPGQLRVGTALAMLEIKRGQPRRAIQVAEAMIKREPGNVIALNLLGVARVADKDLAGARKAYEKAVASDNRFLPARLNLAKLDATEGKHDAARTRLAAILKEQTNHTQAMIELAKLEESLGHLNAAIQQLQKVRALEPKNIEPAMLLVDLYLRKGESEKALNLAKEMESVDNTDLRILAAEGRAHVAVGKPELALILYKRMTSIAKYDITWQYRIAKLQLDAGGETAALYNLDKALSGNPDYIPALALLTEIQIKSGKIGEAEARAQSMVKRHPGQSTGYRLLGDAAMARGRHDEAIARYRTALEKEPGSDSIIRLYQACIRAKRHAQAAEIMTGWLKSHPNDDDARLAFAEGYLRAGNLSSARSEYETLLKRRDDDAGIFNNLANILLQQGDKAALGYAEKAHRLAPASAAIADTLGWVLVQQNQAENGLRYLREAKLRDSANAEILYHLASALDRLGRTAEAYQELNQALAGNASFPGIQDAQKLHKRLSAQISR